VSTLTPDNWCSTPDPPPPPPSGRDAVPPAPSALCAMGWRQIMITGLLRDLLARHFAEPLQVEEGDLRHLVWREDQRTGILVESIYRWRGDLVGKRPAVVIKPNGRQNVRLGIQDAAGSDLPGARLYQTFWVGSHTLFCIHGSGAAADILATEVQRELAQFHPVITDHLGLYSWQVTEVGPVAELEEAEESFVVPVTVAWTFSEMWKVTPETAKLRRVTLDVLLDGASVR